jgi:hypothetical protein
LGGCGVPAVHRLSGPPGFGVGRGAGGVRRSGEPAAIDEWLLVLDRSAAASVLQPPPLSTRAVAGRVCERLGSEPDEAFSGACLDATGGNPLFV